MEYSNYRKQVMWNKAKNPIDAVESTNLFVVTPAKPCLIDLCN